MRKPQVNQEFFGQSLTPADCEMLALSRVAPSLRVAESLLFTKKWFDVRAASGAGDLSVRP
jgi:hypothetical protein